MTTATTSIDETVARYFDAWNSSSDDRAEAVAAAFSDDAYYCDGAAEAVGHQEIGEMMAGVAAQLEGGRFELASPIDSHHSQARFAWCMRGADGTPMLEGIDAVRLTDEGKISAALGFFGVDIPDASTGTTAHTFHWERTYDTPADRLFALVSDLSVYAEVAPNLIGIEVLSGEGLGMVRRCTNPEGEAWTETYTEWVPGERFTTVVDVSTYPPSLAAMIAALQMSVSVEGVSESQATVLIDVSTELTDVGLQVLRDGGAADALFQPILDGWSSRLD